MSDAELLQSAGLISEDAETGKRGYNLAAIMLLGRDDVIFTTNTVYRTDALLRKVNVDRYDDREIVQTNLIDSYDQLMQFARKHLLDKFHLEDDSRVSLRSIITREMLVNTLMHREFTSSHYARFVIEKNRMYTENANRAVSGGVIIPENFEPDSKNPIIAAFFRNIGFADELGSGVRRLNYYVPKYSGKAPEMIDGDIFRLIVPLDDEYSFDVEVDKVLSNGSVGDNVGDNDGNVGDNGVKRKIVKIMCDNPTVSARMIAEQIGVASRTVERTIDKLKTEGLIEHTGSPKGGHWVVKKQQ